MAVEEAPDETSREELVVACSLESAALATQAEHWTALRRRAEVGKTVTPAGMRLRFRDDDDVAAELEQLVGIENHCCSWAKWTVARDEGELVLEVTSTGYGVGTIHAMFSESRALGVLKRCARRSGVHRGRG